MTDQAIPADKVREIVTAMCDAMRREDDTYPEVQFLDEMSDYIRDLEALLPSRPTLADMTPEERPACQWAQADVEGRNTRYVIANPDGGDGEATLIDSDGEIDWAFLEYVTPRPDLRQMAWPSDQKSDN